MLDILRIAPGKTVNWQRYNQGVPRDIATGIVIGFVPAGQSISKIPELMERLTAYSWWALDYLKRPSIVRGECSHIDATSNHDNYLVYILDLDVVGTVLAATLEK